jgi:DNA-binding transcriptional LysR family regulator
MDQLRALRVFAAIADAGSLAGAARTLDLAPAVVTRTLAELEAHLGARLLQRTTRRVALTEAGGSYLESTRRVLSAIDEADAQAGASTAEPRGTVRVVSPASFAVHQIAPRLADFRALYPQLAIELTTPGPLDAADEGFDVTIVQLAQRPLEGDFVARRLARSHFVLCAAPAYLKRRGTPREPEDLLAHEGLLPAVAAARRELTLQRGDGARRITLPTPAPALASQQLEPLWAAALAGAGIAGLPSFMVADALRDGRLVRVLPEWLGATLTLYAAMPTRKHLPARTRAFVDFLVRSFGGEHRDPWLDGAGAGAAAG